MSGSFVKNNSLLMSEDRGEWADWWKVNNNSNNHLLQPRHAEYHLCCFSPSVSKFDLCVQRTTAKNRKQQFPQAPKFDNRRLEKALPGPMSLDFNCNIQVLWGRIW